MSHDVLPDWSRRTVLEGYLATIDDERGSGVPLGTVTFLLTDVEGSTRLWERDGDTAAAAIERQRQIVGAAIAAHRGVRPEEQGEGDSTVAVFVSAIDAVAAALDIQRGMASESWPDARPVRVRIGIHTGEARRRGESAYAGVALHRCARLRDVGHGGQTLLSAVTATIVGDALPAGAWLRDMSAHRLRDLSRPEQIFELRHPGLTDDFPPLRSLDVLANNLPAQLTSFIGRSHELVDVERLVAGQRLVTLTGSGGCGKTRLAVHVAAALADRWPDGVWWVDLGPVTDPALVAELAATTVRVLVEPGSGPLRSLVLQLRERQLLVCLDNCEHLLDASAELADTLLRSCPNVSVLATSREPLGIAGEVVWRVPSLVEHDAVSLFADRAAHVSPGFTVDDDNVAAIATICRRLDGIPLAVELAAAWMRAMTPEQIAAGLDDRFRLLSGAPRGVTARQQTLTASVDWSHDLLDAADRAVFRQLAAFAGGFTLDAAGAVCAIDDHHAGSAGERVDRDDSAILAVLGRLVDKSLVQVDQGGGVARYRLLETIRQYAHDQLHGAGETAATRDRHLDHFIELAETAQPELCDGDQDTWLARLEAEHDNLRAALDWGLSGSDPERGRQLAAALAEFWLLHGHTSEGVERLTKAIERTPDDRSERQASLFAGLAAVAGVGGRLPITIDAAQRGIEIAAAIDDDRNHGRCLGLLAYVQFYLDFDAARQLGQEAQRRAEAVGDGLGADLGLVLEALSLTNGSRHDEAIPLHELALRRARRRGDRLIPPFALAGLFYATVEQGDVPRAERLAMEAIEVAEPLGDYFTVGSAMSNAAWIKGIGGHIADGRRLLEPVVRLTEGADADVPTMTVHYGKLLLWDGDLDGATLWFEAWEQGGRLTLDDAIAYVTRARGARQRPSTGWASLTPTERQVVTLVVDGLTNPAIGERLFISRATVKTHLSHVYAKLGVTNRTELATLAAKRDAT